MPTIGWFEILIIVAVAIVVIGPKDFPFMLKKVGSWIGSAKRYISDVQKEVSILDTENFGEDQTSNKDNINKNDKK
jgi:sec-independent protein translocase protein TatB